MSAGNGMPIVNYGPDPQGTWNRGVLEAGQRHNERLRAATDYPVVVWTQRPSALARLRRWLSRERT